MSGLTSRNLREARRYLRDAADLIEDAIDILDQADKDQERRLRGLIRDLGSEVGHVDKKLDEAERQ